MPQSCQASASDLSKGMLEPLGEKEKENARQKGGKGALEARGQCNGLSPVYEVWGLSSPKRYSEDADSQEPPLGGG